MNKKVLISLFLAFIMISSIAGFIIGSPTQTGDERIKYKGYTFIQTPQGYLTYLENSQVLISSDPRNVPLYQGLEGFTLERLNSARRIYFTFNPSENIQSSFAYFNTNIRPRLTKSLISACTVDVPECANLPLITCQDASESNTVIQIELAESSSLTFNNNCLLLKGNPSSLKIMFDSVILDLLLY